MDNIHRYLICLWEDWNRNDLSYQTVSEMAKDYGVTSECMASMLAEGNRLTNIENGLED